MSWVRTSSLDLEPGEEIVWHERTRLPLGRFLRQPITVMLLASCLPIVGSLIPKDLSNPLPDLSGLDWIFHGTFLALLLFFVAYLAAYYLWSSASQTTITNRRVRAASPGAERTAALEDIQKIVLGDARLTLTVAKIEAKLEGPGVWFRPSIQAGEGPKRLVCDVRHPERVAEDLRLAGLLPDDVLVTTARIGGRPLTAPIVVTLAGLAVLFGGLGGALAIRDAYGKFASLPALFLVLAVGVPLLFKGMRPLMEALQATEHDQE